MAVQTSYSENIGVAFPGMRANLVPETVITRTVKNDTMPFGVVAVQAEGDFEATTIPNLATADPGGYVGISVRDQSVDPNEPNEYAERANANIMTKGTVWVNAYETVDAGDPVYFVTATGLLGKTSASSTLIPNARWETSRTGAGLAMIRLG